jgi:hypothetical protein
MAAYRLSRSIPVLRRMSQKGQDLTSLTTFDRRGDPQETFGDSRPSFSEWISAMREGLLYQTYHPQSEGDGGWQSHELQSWCW